MVGRDHHDFSYAPFLRNRALTLSLLLPLQFQVFIQSHFAFSLISCDGTIGMTGLVQSASANHASLLITVNLLPSPQGFAQTPVPVVAIQPRCTRNIHHRDDTKRFSPASRLSHLSGTAPQFFRLAGHHCCDASLS